MQAIYFFDKLNTMALTTEQYLDLYAKDCSHAREVSRLSMIIFDEVCQKVKEMSNKKRKMLSVAAMLHDIGYSINSKGHNKHSQNLILQNGIEGFNEKDLKIISCIARYHRGSLPDKKEHEIYCDLEKKDRKTVKKLAGILRIADGLDRAHCGLIKKVQLDYDDENLIITFILTPNNEEYRPDISYAIRKRDLFEIGFKCQTILVFQDHNAL